MVRTIVRLEGAAVFLLSLYFYQHLDFNWVFFLILILTPDISIAAYYFGERIGSKVYNLAHNYVLAATLLCLGVAVHKHLFLGLGLVLAAHIGADRLLGYGLKYPHSFKETHIQKL